MSGVTAWLVDDQAARVSTPDHVAELYELLDAGERRRADRKGTVEGRRRYVLAHGAMRRVVGEYLGAPPEELVWRIGPHGKPELDGKWTGVQVNLSHSGGLCLIAVSEQRAVGIDVQRHVPGLAVVAMARRYFTAGEAERVARAEDPVDMFAWLWARKEAVSKAAGGRLTQILPLPTSDFGVVETASSIFHVLDLDLDPDLGAAAGFRAAVALEGPAPFSVELRTWQP